MWNLVRDWKKEEKERKEEEEEEIKAPISQWQLQVVGRLRRQVKRKNTLASLYVDSTELSKTS